MQGFTDTFSMISIIFIGVLNILSFVFLLLVAYNFRYTVTTRTVFMEAFIGADTRSIFSRSKILFLSYCLVLTLITLGLDIAYFIYVRPL